MVVDFLVIGSGIAGMSSALLLARMGSVLLLSKKGVISGSTPLAQGGIAALKKNEHKNDTLETHYTDTIRAGSGHNDTTAVELLVSRAADAIDFLEQCDIRFDESLHLEGGHSFPRIRHVADHTGLTIAHALRKKVRETEEIQLLENAFVSDLLVRDGTVHGAEYVHEGVTQRIFAAKTILACGGAGQIFAKTTNPAEVTGDGIALAVRAGAARKDLEFVQFHPTALDGERSPLLLLSEALRGAGARIVDKNVISICDPLAPRDEVSRSIAAFQKHSKVFLDLSAHPGEYWTEKFPDNMQALAEYGYMPDRDLIPITPAAHFFCGGIKTDLNGNTNLGNLSAVGEVACTGVHGANRLASNSLLEGVVFSLRIAEEFAAQAKKVGNVTLPSPDAFFVTTPYFEETARDEEVRAEIRRICWDYLGIVRTMSSIDKAAQELAALTPSGTETKNLQAVATFLAEAAKIRQDSLGCHFIDSDDRSPFYQAENTPL